MTISTGAEFADTNIVVYAYQTNEPEKHEVARHLVGRLVDDGNGAASIQVLQELYVTLVRQPGPGIAPEIAHTVVADVAANFRIVEANSNDVLLAIDNARSWQVSFWDAMLLTTANKAGARVLWTEDLNHGQVYGGVTARNPFHPTAC